MRLPLLAAKKVESFVKDPVTVTMEVYKVAYLCTFCAGEPNYLFFGGNEYWNPVCGVDALLPPFSNQPPTVVQNPDGSYGYQGIPETYTPILLALKLKNARNNTPMKLINYLPNYSQINVEWPSSMYAWQSDTGLDTYNVTTDFLFGNSGYYTVSTTAKPLTLCASPATMKMLGFARAFQRNGHTIDDFNSPQYNMNVTLSGTDGAVVIPDLTNYPPPYSPPYTWFYNPNNPSIVSTQLPKAYYEQSFNYDLPQNSCSDPTQCIFPLGFNGGHDLVGVFNHEINHVLGIMQSQYYKIGGEETVTRIPTGMIFSSSNFSISTPIMLCPDTVA